MVIGIFNTIASLESFKAKHIFEKRKPVILPNWHTTLDQYKLAYNQIDNVLAKSRILKRKNDNALFLLSKKASHVDHSTKKVKINNRSTQELVAVSVLMQM